VLRTIDGPTEDVYDISVDKYHNFALSSGVFCHNSILDEGVDVPNIDVLILAGGGKSSINTLQRVGRGLRKGGNIDKLYVVDTLDFQQYHLLKHSLQRLDDYKNEDCFVIEEVK
jgi:superfamily II DNA or RNA helicase